MITIAVNSFLKPFACFMRVALYLFILLFGLAYNVCGQSKNYSIDISYITPIKQIALSKLGGSNPNGEKIAVNNYYITRGGVPVIPITGEMHYSRYPHQYWDESIKKIKAGGVNTIATYVFWNIHEEKEGIFDWSGDKDLRSFIELCKKNDINVIVRIGPFDHGEIRNGGIPDWILSKPLTIRSNDSLYLHYVSILYNQIGKQLKGLYYKDGGPIIGVQLENEMQHSASPWGLTYPGQPHDFTVADYDRGSAHEGVSVASGKNAFAEEGNAHMRTLKLLALNAGIDVPLYTATGWGYAALIPNETLPVTAAYAYPTWTEKREFSPFYLYKDLHKTPDYAPVRYEPLDYPAFAAELGSGIMSTYSRRPLVPAESIDALINRCLGGGANGIGYYMYHGGSTPVGQHYFFDDEAYGYPKISYDFQAPIGEYGQVRPSYDRLKLLHFFLNDFSAELAPLITTLPENNTLIKPDDIKDLRYAVRSNGTNGFLFINNFQDNTTTNDQQNIHIAVKLKSGEINIPEHNGFTLKSGENIILPFNFNLNGTNLIYATAQLLTKGDDKEYPYYIFFTPEGINSQFCFSNSNTSVMPVTNCRKELIGGKIYVNSLSDQPAEFTTTGKNGRITHILVVNKTLALQSSLQQINGSRHLVFSNALALPADKSIELLSTGANEYAISIFPKLKNRPEIDRGLLKEDHDEKIFSRYTIHLENVTLTPQVLKTGTRKLTITLPKSIPDGLNDIFLNIDYIGDTGMGFLDGELVADEFYKGIPWQIGLKRFMDKDKGQPFGFYFRPLFRNASFMVDLPLSVTETVAKSDQTLQINNITYTPEYKSFISFK